MNTADINRRCDCGSGKKYKNCCGSSLATKSRSNTDIVTINMEIAYRGQIGRKREKFCREFISKQQEVYTRISDRQNEMVSVKSETISCKKGCAYCCVFFISATIQEAEAIVYYMYHHRKVMDNFLRSYTVWRERVREGGDLFIKPGKTNALPLKNEAGGNSGNCELGNLTAYAMQGIPCPFLTDGTCSIYEVRPFVCAGLVVTTPGEWCDSSNPSHIADRKVYTAYERSMFPDTPFYYGKLDKLVGAFMPIMVHNILAGGPSAISRIPGLETFEKDFMKDPEVRTAMGKFQA